MHLVCPHCHHPIELVAPTPAEVVCPSCGSSVRVSEPGSTTGAGLPDGLRELGRFTILGLVGQGAFGAVYRARDTVLQRVVALKVPRAGNWAGDGSDGERFFREARSAAHLRHPSIVSLHEIFTLNGRPVLVSDFVEGVTLGDLLAVQGLTPHAAAELLAEVADALHYAHTSGVVHRDVKPSNILLGPDRRPRLTDFGLAKREAGEVTVTVQGQVLGTPAYMAPEQARGEAHAVDGRADVYSLGVILYQMLTGELPFRGTTRMLLYQVLHDEPKPPRKLNDRIPRDLETVCLKAMAKEPGRRYPTAAELAADLRRFLAGKPVVARPVGRLERGVRWCRRNPALAWASGAAVASLVVGVAAATLFGMREYQQAERARESERAERQARAAADADRRRAVEQKDRADREADEARRQQLAAEEMNYLAQIHRADAELRAGSADRAALALDATAWNRRGWEYRYLRRRAEGTSLVLRGHAGGVWSVAFSPDGTRLAYADSGSADGGTARIWDVRTGKPLFSCRHAGVMDVAFSPDGSRLATSASGDHTTRVWDARTGKELLALQGADRLTAAAFSPDGTRLATGSEAGNARVWDAITGMPILDVGNKIGRLAFSPDGSRLATASSILDARTGAVLLTFRGQGNSTTDTDVAFSPDGSRLATGPRDSNILRIWDARTGQESVRLALDVIPFSLGTGVAFAPDGSRLAAADGRAVGVWDARTGERLFTLPEHGATVEAVAYSPDGTRLVTGSLDGTARVWDARDGTRQACLELSGSAVAFSPDGARLATSSLGQGSIWDARTGKQLCAFRDAGSSSAVAYSPDGTRVATGHGDNIARVWDARTGKELLALQGHTGAVGALAFSPDGCRVVTGSWDGTAGIWDARSGKRALTLKSDTENHINPGVNEVLAVAYSPDGSRVVTGSYGHTARIWDGRTGNEVMALRGHQHSVRAVAYSPDGSLLATGGEDKTVRLWDARSAKEILVLRDFGAVNAVAFSPDGGQLATASGNAVRLWDPHRGNEKLVLRHDGPVRSLAFSPDGTRLASADEGGAVRVWDSRLDAETLILRPGGDVNDWAVGPDGRSVYTSDGKGRGFVWDLTTGQSSPAVAAPPGFRQGLDTLDRRFRGHYHQYGGGEEGIALVREGLLAGYDPWREDDALRRDWAVSMHCHDAEEAIRTGDAFAAAFHLARLDTILPDGPQARARRGLIRLRLGRRSAGLADLAHAELNELDGFYLYSLSWHALACLATGDTSGYQAACTRMSSVAGPKPAAEQVNQIAMSCCLGPKGHGDPAAVLRLAEGAAGARAGYDTLVTLGAALLRAGRFEDAVLRLGEAIRMRGTLESVHAELLLALAHHQLGHDAEARRWLATAATWMDRYRVPGQVCGTLGAGPAGPLPVIVALRAERPDPRAARDGTAIRSWLEMEVLLAEAEASLAGAKASH